MITGQLGAGAMATVSKAIQRSLERVVAVKQILPHLAKDKEFVDRFQREARAAANLRHENVVQIIDFGSEGDNHYIVTEYIDGPNLRDIILASNKNLSLPVAISAAVQVLNGLEHSHNSGVIHRDIKPANIMTNRNGVIKITDFGIAHAVDLPSLTVTGNVMGTPSYMSPEQANGKKVDQRADIFSVGVMLYEMLTGALPFQGTTIYTIIRKIVSEPHTPLKIKNPALPDSLCKIAERALEKDVSKRYFDATEFAYALEDFAQETGFRIGSRVVKDFIGAMDGIKEATSSKLSSSVIEKMKPSTASAHKARPTVAMLPIQGCFGCQMNLLDLHEEFEDFIKDLDIQFSYLMDVKKMPKVQIGIVEGCVANSENEEKLHELRENCEVLIAMGSCASFGGVPGLRNLFSSNDVIMRAYKESESIAKNGGIPMPEFVPSLTSHVRAVPDVVKTDCMIPGCPPPHDLIVSSISALLNGTTPNLRTRAVCYECKREKKSILSAKKEFIASNVLSTMELEYIDPNQCFLEQGVLCLGMVTREGCHARCMKNNFPCQGCMGPAPEVRETGAKWINTIGSLLPSGSIRFRDDLVGFSYRYTLPISMMPFKQTNERTNN